MDFTLFLWIPRHSYVVHFIPTDFTSFLWVSQCFVLYEVKLLFHNFAFASQLQNLDKKWDHPLGKECFLSQSLPQKNGGKSGSFQAIWPIGRTRVLYPATFGCNEGEILSNHTSHQKGPGTTFIRQCGLEGKPLAFYSKGPRLDPDWRLRSTCPQGPTSGGHPASLYWEAAPMQFFSSPEARMHSYRARILCIPTDLEAEALLTTWTDK